MLAPYGILQVAVLYGAWVGGMFLVMAVFSQVLLSYGTNWSWAILAATYYSMKALLPGEIWPYLRKLNWDIAKDHPYFKAQTTIFTEGSAPKIDSQTMLCYHPHGILCCGWTMNGVSNSTLGSVQWLVGGGMLWIPLVHYLLEWLSAGTVSKSNMTRQMKVGKNIALLPGGFEEATLFVQGHHRVYIKNRKGFIKMALRYGYQVIPVYTFGEEQTYTSMPYFLSFRLWLNKFKIPAVYFSGIGYLPYPSTELVTVVGKALCMPVIDDPTVLQVNTHHARYVKALTTLFDTHKEKYNHPGSKLHLEVF